MRRSTQRVVITALGLGQILGWGSTYYLPAVLAKPIAADTGWSLPWIVTGLSIGSITAGLIAPRVGRAIQIQGGRPRDGRRSCPAGPRSLGAEPCPIPAASSPRLGGDWGRDGMQPL